MAADNTHIDRLFKDHLDGFREKPPLAAWDRLKEELLLERRHRRIVMFRWSAAAAAIILAFLAGYYFAVLKQDQLLEQEPGITKSTTITPQTDEHIAAFDQTIPPNDTQPAGIMPSSQSPVAQSDSEYGKKQQPVLEPSQIEPEAEELAIDESGKNPDQAIPAESASQESMGAENADQLALQEQSIQEEPKEIPPSVQPVYDYSDYEEPNSDYAPSGGWSVGGSFSPVYSYRNISIQAEELPPGVVPEENYYNEGEDPLYSWSGGLDLAYDFSGRFGFQTGAYLSNLGMVSPEVIAYESEAAKDIFKISSSTGLIDVKLRELPEEFVDNSIRRDSSTNTLYIDSDVYQLFSYVEIPLVLNYRILNKRLGLQFNGGLSPGIMTHNETYFHFEGEQINLDRSGEFYSMIYNSVVGFGFKYSITKQLSLTLDPTFKYSLNSIRKDHSIEYHPYSFSVFTGLRFSF
jgi:hypothetical protein